MSTDMAERIEELSKLDPALVRQIDKCLANPDTLEEAMSAANLPGVVSTGGRVSGKVVRAPMATPEDSDGGCS